VCFPQAILTSKNGKITLTFPADLAGVAPVSIFDTVGTLQATDDVDLDLSLEAGRVVVRNSATAGAAVQRLRFWNQTWTIVLDNPGSQVLFDLTSRWPAGVRFQLRPADTPPPVPPVATATLLVLKGNVAVDVGGVALTLAAPPGPAEIRWDTLRRTPPAAIKHEQLPPWADLDRPLNSQGRRLAAAFDRFRKELVAAPEEAVARFVEADDPTARTVAMWSATAFDALEILEGVLQKPRTPADWDLSITLLRHWVARSTTHDLRLFDYLTRQRSYSVAEARIIVQLLLGFSDEDLRLAETYQVLLDYVGHEQALIRNLAAWHLLRLVPEVRRFAYQPAGSRDAALRIQEQWRSLLRPESLPLRNSPQ
jgi:hypothetical protein